MTMVMMRLGRRAGIMVALVALVAVAGLAAVAVGTKGEAPPPAAVELTGVEIPAEQLRALVEGAEACPSLTPARLAGQVMERSKFDTKAARGIARLSDEVWKTWRPWERAKRSDPRASILALAHRTCDLVGRVRVGGLTGDLWLPAVAALHSGVPAVVEAKGVPKKARIHAARVEGYARWYERHEQFGVLDPAPVETSSPATPEASPTADNVEPSRTPLTPTTTAPRTEVDPRSNKGVFKNPNHGCLSATAARDGTKLRMARCDGSQVQQWEIKPNGTIRSVGLCMDAANASTANFTPVQVAHCSGNPAQQFRVKEAHKIYSPYANKCVNIHVTKDQGARIVLYSCMNQTSQRFVFERE